MARWGAYPARWLLIAVITWFQMLAFRGYNLARWLVCHGACQNVLGFPALVPPLLKWFGGTESIAPPS